MQGTTRLCDRCGEPALYHESDTRFDHCDECARQNGAEHIGRAVAALAFIGVAVGMLRYEANLTDEQLRAAFEEIITSPSGEGGGYPIGGDGVLGPDRRKDRQWARFYGPIREEVAA
jgi:hypothetical protein